DDRRRLGPGRRRTGRPPFRGGAERDAQACPEHSSQDDDDPDEGHDGRAPLQPVITRRSVFIHISSLAPGPHPRRDLTLIPRLGFAGPRLGMAAGASSLAPGPHPRRDLTLIPRLGFAGPRLGMAAGASSLAPGPHPQRDLTLIPRL